MATGPPERGEPLETSLSTILEGILDEADQRPISFGDLLDRTAERGFGLLMLVLGLPMLIPVLPPGSSTVVGPVYSLFAVQMLRGSQRPWVPRRLRGVVLTGRAVRALRHRGIPLLRRMERLSRPRGTVVSERMALRAAGAMVFLMGLVLLSPLPFMNTLPALSVMLIGMGLLNRDAVFMLAGVATGIGVLALIGASAGLIVVLIQRLRSPLP